MSYRLSQSELILGIEEEDNTKCLLLDLVPASHSQQSLASGEAVTTSFCLLPISIDKTSRMLLLLEKMVVRLQDNVQIDFIKSPIFWLLPEIDLHDEKPLASLACQFKAKFPQLFKHTLSQSFAFGRSAITHALKKAQQLITGKKVPSVYLLSVDTLFHDIESLYADNQLLNVETGEGMIPSEAVLFTHMQGVDDGLNIDFVGHDSALKQHMTACTESLLFKSSEHLQALDKYATFSQLYLPGNGLPTLINIWLGAYHRLAQSVSPQTKIQQMGLFTGELGSNCGLYNLLHIYQRYQEQTLQGYTLQLEIANQLHQGVVLYSWGTRNDV